MPELKQDNIASAALHLHRDELPKINAMFRRQYLRIHSLGLHYLKLVILLHSQRSKFEPFFCCWDVIVMEWLRHWC